MSDYLSPEDLAAELPLGKSTVYRALENGELPGEKVQGKWVTLRSQLEERVRDGRTPKPRNVDPMPSRRGRSRGSFRETVVDLGSRRAVR